MLVALVGTIVAVESVMAVASVAIAVLAVFAILTVAVVVAVLLLPHIDRIEHEVDLWQFVLALEAVDEVEVGTRTIVGTADEQAHLGDAPDGERVADEADRRCVEQDVVVVLLEELDGEVELFAGDELARVGRDDARGQHVEVLVHHAVDNLLVERVEGMVRAGEECRDAALLCGDAEELDQSGLADVESDDDHALAHQRKRHGEVRRDECLALAGYAAGAEDDLLVALEDEAEVRAQASEGFLH